MTILYVWGLLNIWQIVNKRNEYFSRIQNDSPPAYMDKLPGIVGEE